MYKALFTADIHASNSLPFAQRDPHSMISDRLKDTISVLDEMRKFAVVSGVEHIWVLGDLVDKRIIDAVTLKSVTAALKQMLDDGLRIFLLPGNHEACDAKARHSILDAYSSMGITVFAAPEWLATASFKPDRLPSGMCFGALPFQPDDVVAAVLDSWSGAARSEPFVVMLHQSIIGGRIGSWVCPEGIDQELLEPFSTTLAGHFHSPQKLCNGVYYLGAPLQHNFADSGDERGFWSISIDDNGYVKSDMIPTSLPKFHDVKFTPKTGITGVGFGDYFRIRVCGSDGEVRKKMPQAEELCQSLLKNGARYAKAIPHPDSAVNERKARIASENCSLQAMVANYIDVCDTAGLSRGKLESLGRELVSEAES